jgi:hypothetical protein
MSYSRVVGPFFQEFDNCNDNEFIGWYEHLKRELDRFYKELDSNFQHRDRVCNEKLDQYSKLLLKLKECFEGLNKEVEPLITSKKTLDKGTNDSIKTQLQDFNGALGDLEVFIKEEMYSNILEHIILKLKSILLSITNYFLGRDLQYSRMRVAGGLDSVYIIETSGPAFFSPPFSTLPERSKRLSFLSDQADQACNTLITL